MKRSDMANLLKRYLPIESGLRYDDALDIIDFLEGCGMRPPLHRVEETYDCLTLFKNVEGWEPED